MINCLFPEKILLPKTFDMTAWACIACDQFTGDLNYWKELEEFVGDKKSTLNLILPEIYLSNDLDNRIKKVNNNIDDYIKSGVFSELPEGYILTVRKTPFVERRIGLVGKIDLEKYEYSKKSSALIRSTEGTIEERIPPRLKIRKDAKVEFPHVMILYDDEKREINEELYKNRNDYKKVYDFELNMGGGSIEGYFIPKGDAIVEKFNNLLDEERLTSKYGFNDKFMFAVGDGNHSLATAKAHWENVKKTLGEEEIKTHPARYALAEIVNIYDEGIYFEPIYRFVSGVDRQKFITGLKKVKGDFSCYDGEKLKIDNNASLPESIKSVDEYIKEYLSQFGGNVDYIHGENEITEMVNKDQTAVAVLFDKMDKQDLFKFVSKNGSLPRKTFSMGEAREKRYYLEGRKIVKD